MSQSVSPAFLPGRNLIFLSIAVAHAAGLQADEVHTGINSVEFSGYPDCRPEFLDSFINTAALANPGGPLVRAPLLGMSKPQIAQLAARLGIGEHDTWSCYKPKLLNGQVAICGECDACRLHEHAWHPELIV
jgi:7-cyano-7-deazaguanine synthase